MQGKNHLDELNPKQREAAIHKDGPLLVVAGAGAGKTKTITHRIVNLINEGVAPDSILAVTFTNKAAKEMRERILKALEERRAEHPPRFPRQPSVPAQGFALTTEPSSDHAIEGSKPAAEGVPPFVSTFHSLGVHILKENARRLGLSRYFSILDEGDVVSMIREIQKELGIDPKQYEPRKIRGAISREKGKFAHIDEYAGANMNPFGRIVTEVWRKYEDRKAGENALDFDDLLLKTVKLLKEHEDVREHYQSRWQYIHVDEYQDTNEVQYLLTKLLAEKHQNICVVGDGDQNIYSWRGANLKNILNFEKDYKNAKVVLLEENYRSTQNILEAANEVIKKNQFRVEKNLFTRNDTGEKIGLYEALSEAEEADFVATKILEIIDSGATDAFEGLGSATARARGIFQQKNIRTLESISGDADSSDIKILSSAPPDFSDIAVLYRTNFQSRVLEEAMLRYNIPYQVLGVKFFERKEVKDTLAYLRAALNPESLSDIKRIINFPKRGIGKATLDKVFAKNLESLPASTRVKINSFYQLLTEIKEKIETVSAEEAIKFTVKKSGIERELLEGGEDDAERLANIKELATLALKYEELEPPRGIEKLLEEASLATDQDSLTEKSAKKDKFGVKLMTVHASKGLEFKYVFVVGLEDGLFPASARGGEKRDDEEERRLFYVALTRARHKIFLSFANFRTIFGSRQINAPSEFLSDIPADLLERERDKSGVKTIYI